VLLGAFIVQERRAQEPVLPLRLFKAPVFNIVSAALFLTTLSFFTVIVFMPVFLQTVTGVSATESGVLLLSLLITGTVSTIISGRAISKTGRYKRFPLLGLAIMAAGLLALSTIDADTSKATIAALLAFFGVGFGLVSQVLTVAIQNAVDRRDLGIATASANLFRSLGGAIGVATFGALYSGASIFLYAAPVAIAALLVVTLLEEVPLRGKAVAA
jgi:predicted MFS family arabinose efflux permease